MGLDSVELVPAFEDSFGIQIPSSVAERLVSVGNVVSYLFAQQLRRGVQDSDAEPIFERVKAITVEQFGVNADEVFLGSRLFKIWALMDSRKKAVTKNRRQV